MREWLSNLPIVGKWFQVKVPESRRIEGAPGPSNPQLIAERRRSDELEEELAGYRQRESSLKQQFNALQEASQTDRQTLAALEEMLRDPDRAQNAIVYYQLRQIWFACHRELIKLVEELAENMVEEERMAHLERFRKSQNQEVKDLERVLEDVRQEYQSLQDKRQKAQEELLASQKIWHHFKRKRLESTITELAEELKPVQQQLDDTRRHIHDAQTREAPPYPGLSLEGRRRVNLAAIALAQYLFLRFRKHNIAEMARSARVKPVHEAYFGPAEECLGFIRQLKEVDGRWRTDKERSGKIKRRAKFLANKVIYSQEHQTVPDVRTLDYLQPSISLNEGEVVGDAAPLPVNVLEMDIWDLRAAMK